ncbi:MAG: alpha/beta hydrolase [Pseudomonadota bacterium]
MLKKFHAFGTAACLISAPMMAQENPDPIPFAEVQTPEDSGAILLYDGVAPGSEGSTLEEVWRNAGTERWATNVSVPTLLPILPEDPATTRAAVIVIPGGGFQFVSMDNEGYPIANWLAERGIAAFVLKYRTMETPTTAEEFGAFMSALWAPQPGDAQVDVTQGIPFAVADAQTALEMVRAKSDEWGYDADNIGMLGFSAGAITALSVTLSEDQGAPKPDHLGYIYGPMNAVEVPDEAPPMFAALAADDGLFAGQGFGIVEAWQAAGKPVELHYYQSGGHGFGSYKRGVPADDWFDQYIGWMEAQDLLTPPAAE